MGAIKLEQFGGMLPAWSAHLLPTGQAAYSENGYLFGGNLTGWRAPKSLRSLVNSSARMVYRIPSVSQAQAKAYFVFTALPHQDDNITVGDLTYTFKLVNQGSLAAGKMAPNEVLIAADIPGTVLNFITALTADQGQNTNAGTSYGENTVANGDVYYTQPGGTPPVGLSDPSYGQGTFGVTTYWYAAVGAFAFGAAYNNVTVDASASGRILALYDLLALTNLTTSFTGGSNPTFDSRITSDSIWMEFNDPDTNVVKSPVANDEWNRFYWASPSDMPKYNTYDRINAAQPAWLLGVPPPGCAPILSVVGGGNNQTLGNVTLSGGEVAFNANRVYLVPIVTTGDTQIIDIQWRLSGVNGHPDQNQTPTTDWAGVVYDDDGSSGDVTVPGKPSNLLNTTQIVKGVTSDVPNIASFTNPTGLNGNTVYWIGVILDTQNVFAAGPAGGALNVTHFEAVFSNGPPTTAPTDTMQQNTLGINLWGDFLTDDVIEARSYAYTWVTEYGEEGPPSPPTVLNGWTNGTWNVGLWLPPPDDLGILRTFKKVRLYRTVVGNKSSDFFFVDDINISDLQTDTPQSPNVVNGAYVDTKKNNLVALNELIPSEDWFPPPANMQGITVMQNGMLAGFVGNELWFCDPYHPWAWPPGKMLTTDYTIVGLGVTQGNLVVCTASHPYVVSGANPDNMTMQKGSVSNPCLSRASILSGDKAVVYMSRNGLISVDASGVATNTTDLWFTRDRWQQLTPQKYTRAIYMASQYYCFGTVSPPSVSPADNEVAQQGFAIEIDNDVASFTIWPQPGGHRLGLQVLTSPINKDILNVITDPWSGSGMLVADGQVWYFDFADPAPTIVPFTWRSKIYQQNVKRNYSAIKVFFSIPPGSPTPGERNTKVASDPSWDTLSATQLGIIRTYVDVDGTGSLTLIDAREITRSGELLRIVDGFKAEQWAWEIEGRINISDIQIATSPKELGNV